MGKEACACAAIPKGTLIQYGPCMLSLFSPTSSWTFLKTGKKKTKEKKRKKTPQRNKKPVRKTSKYDIIKVYLNFRTET